MSGVGHSGEDMRDKMSAADMIGLGSAGGADFELGVKGRQRIPVQTLNV